MMHCRNEIPLALSCDGIRSADQFSMNVDGLKGGWGLGWGILELKLVVCMCLIRVSVLIDAGLEVGGGVRVSVIDQSDSSCPSSLSMDQFPIVGPSQSSVRRLNLLEKYIILTASGERLTKTKTRMTLSR